MRVLVLDNYDSFTWNLVQAIEPLGAECIVHRSDRIEISEIHSLQPDRIVLSPGPFGPERSGVCADAVRIFSNRVPILGVCLGMQVIASVAGAQVQPSGHPVHGRASSVHHTGANLFVGLRNPFAAARYHSLHVVPAPNAELPQALEIIAWSDDEPIMAFRWRGRSTYGVLFHPESFLTEFGPALLRNFLKPCEALKQ